KAPLQLVLQDEVIQLAPFFRWRVRRVAYDCCDFMCFHDATLLHCVAISTPDTKVRITIAASQHPACVRTSERVPVRSLDDALPHYLCKSSIQRTSSGASTGVMSRLTTRPCCPLRASTQ